MTTSGEDEDHATTEAAHWLLALEGDPEDRALRRRFNAWLKASPANAAAWTATSDIYDLMGKTEPAHSEHWAPYAAETGRGVEAIQEQRRPIDRVQPLRPRTPVRRLAVGMIGAAAAACLVAVVSPSALLRLQADYVTSTAELRSVRLADGSAVRLGPDSAIAVAFENGDRRVRLLKGEAYFDVVHDAGHPFQVVAQGLKATDIGTAFDVHVADDGTEVLVRQGQVRVDQTDVQPSGSERLAAGDWVKVGRDGGIVRGVAASDEIAPWLDGQIVARDRPMAEVVEELRGYYGGVIVMTDAAIGRQRVTGVYNVADPVAALRAIAGAHGGAVHRISPWLLVITHG